MFGCSRIEKYRIHDWPKSLDKEPIECSAAANENVYHYCLLERKPNIRDPRLPRLCVTLSSIHATHNLRVDAIKHSTTPTINRLARIMTSYSSQTHERIITTSNAIHQFLGIRYYRTGGSQIGMPPWDCLRPV